MLQWQGVAEFVAVADTGSFTKAAVEIGVSVAQVSRQISSLEARLQSKLFYRSTRNVTITEAGQVYYNHCRQVLDGLSEAERALADFNQTPKGKLKITAPVTYGENSIAPLLSDFALEFPALEISLVLSNQVFDLVAESYDMAIRLGQLEDSSMMTTKLASRKYYVCASPDYLTMQGTPHTVLELEQHNCLKGTIEFWRFLEQGKLRHIRVNGSFHCNSGHALVDAALKGIGIVQLPHYYVEDYIQQGQLIPILESYGIPDDGIWAIYPSNRQLSPKIKLLLEYFQANLEKRSADL